MKRTAAKTKGKGYTKADLDAVSDNPELTEADFKKARPFAEVFPELAKTIKRGRPTIGATAKTQLTLRLDEEVVSAYRKTGTGWQSRINKDLRKARGL
ncbi:MAG: hypothetical protein A4S14_00415 [Proteobacteria bacterium SG_bin9]|nr:MAG: hypothetical protein A4S14_00415 [Proteobacteria bacterium SG_bin9]